MLASQKRRPYKAYIKKLVNGFGIKMVNTETEIESVLVLTTEKSNDKMKDFHKYLEKKTMNYKTSNHGFENLPVTNLNSFASQLTYKNHLSDNIFEHRQPTLEELENPDLSSSCISKEQEHFENLEKQSVLFVANTKLARDEGVYFNIPGKLMKVLDEKDKGLNFQFSVKPLTIVVSDHVIRINVSKSNKFVKINKETQTISGFVATEENLEIFPKNLFTVSKAIQTDNHLIQTRTRSKNFESIEYHDVKPKHILFEEQNNDASSKLCPSTADIYKTYTPDKYLFNDSIQVAQSIDLKDNIQLLNTESNCCVLSSHTDLDQKTCKSSDEIKSSSNFDSAIFQDDTVKSKTCNHSNPMSYSNSSLSMKDGKLDSDITVKKIKERLNTVTFSLQQIKSVIDIIDSTEDCFNLAEKTNPQNVTFVQVDDETKESISSEVETKIIKDTPSLRSLCDYCGLFFASGCELQEHSCYSGVTFSTNEMLESLETKPIICKPSKSSHGIALVKDKKSEKQTGGEVKEAKLGVKNQPSMAYESDSSTYDKFKDVPHSHEDHIIQLNNSIYHDNNKHYNNNKLSVSNRLTKSDCFKDRLDKTKHRRETRSETFDHSVPVGEPRLERSWRSRLNFEFLKCNIKSSKSTVRKDSFETIELFKTNRTSSFAMESTLSSNSVQTGDLSQRFVEENRSGICSCHHLRCKQNMIGRERIDDKSTNQPETFCELWPSNTDQIQRLHTEIKNKNTEGNCNFEMNNSCTTEKKRKKRSIFCFKV